ncbi:MAG TPA: hypothetical protein VIF15_12785 [Polyangiaceae bacterium]|jgi:hypothetical protein
MSRSLRSKTAFIALLALAVLALWMWRRDPHGDTGGEIAAEPGLIDGRLWVDSRPDKHTDYVQAAIFLGAANFGLFERASSYDLRLEVFDMTRDARTVKLTFPQNGKAASFGFSVKTCNDLPPFDLCLDVTSNPWGGPKRYHGFSNPEQEDQALGPLAARLRAGASGASQQR